MQEKKQLLCLNASGGTETEHTVAAADIANTDSNESDLDEDSLRESNKKMYGEWIKLCSLNRSNLTLIKSLSQKNDKLESEAKLFEQEILKKNSKIYILKRELRLLKKNVMMLNPGSSIFEEIQNAGQRNHAGLGSRGSLTKGKTVFVPAIP